MIQMLRCPKCYSALTIASQVMCDSCKQVYFVHDGVLFLTDAATSDPRSPTEFMTYDLKDFLQNKRIFGKTITSGVDYAVKEHSLHIFPDKMLSAIGPLCAGKHILDVGSGASPYLSTSISKHKPASYTALDAQFELLRVGRKNSGGGGVKTILLNMIWHAPYRYLIIQLMYCFVWKFWNMSIHHKNYWRICLGY